MSFTRVRALLVIGILAAAALVVTVVALVRDTQAGAAARDACPPGATRVDLTLPTEAAEVKLRVLNGTKTAGVAERVSEDFKDRGFVMQRAAASKSKVADTAVIRYGPRTVGDAQWIQAHFLGEGEMQYSATRATDVIDIVIGDGYRQLATKTEVNQALAQLSAPRLPPGACAA